MWFSAAVHAQLATVPSLESSRLTWFLLQPQNLSLRVAHRSSLSPCTSFLLPFTQVHGPLAAILYAPQRSPQLFQPQWQSLLRCRKLPDAVLSVTDSPSERSYAAEELYHLRSKVEVLCPQRVLRQKLRHVLPLCVAPLLHPWSVLLLRNGGELTQCASRQRWRSDLCRE